MDGAKQCVTQHQNSTIDCIKWQIEPHKRMCINRINITMPCRHHPAGHGCVQLISTFLFRAMQACSASAPVCAAYRMRNSPVKVPGRNRSLPFSLVGVPWWSLRTRRFGRRRRHCGGQRPGERAAAGRSAAAAAQTAQKAVGMRFCREMVSRAGRVRLKRNGACR